MLVTWAQNGRSSRRALKPQSSSDATYHMLIISMMSSCLLFCTDLASSDGYSNRLGCVHLVTSIPKVIASLVIVFLSDCINFVNTCRLAASSDRVPVCSQYRCEHLVRVPQVQIEAVRHSARLRAAEWHSGGDRVTAPMTLG